MKKDFTDTIIGGQLLQYQQEVDAELESILNWWMLHMPDKSNGFWGEIDYQNNTQQNAERGIVLYSRILWTFSAAYLQKRKKEYLLFAERAFNYICTHFKDEVHGGVFWSVDHNGQKLQDKKQVYGLAFCLYGFSEYYRATNNETALQSSKELFYMLEKYCYDKKGGGYFEAFSRNWQPIEDLRLSEKDANECKTMNTHLHVLEAYCNLYRVWGSVQLKTAIISLLDLFNKKIIDANTHKQHLFFSDNWEVRSSIISYGHDIEASWLLYEAAEIIGDDFLIKQFTTSALAMADAATDGIDVDGSMFYEYDATNMHLNKEKHWWPQAEAMVGYFNAYELSDNEMYLQQSLNSWAYIKQYIKDDTHGEWFWGRNENGTTMQKEKAGFWKCPYHNGRACMEISKRIEMMSR